MSNLAACLANFFSLLLLLVWLRLLWSAMLGQNSGELWQIAPRPEAIWDGCTRSRALCGLQRAMLRLLLCFLAVTALEVLEFALCAVHIVGCAARYSIGAIIDPSRAFQRRER